MSSSPWLPADFAHPTFVPLLGGVHLRPIRADDVDIDYPAVMGSRQRLWAKYGTAWAKYGAAWGWPPATMTVEQDRRDLEHHEREIAAHETFNYAILDAEETELLGCVYIDPPREGEEPDADGNAVDVVISWWVVDGCAGTEFEDTLDRFVPDWITSAWPFERPRIDP